MKERYHVTGMTCSACSSHVEKAVSKLDGMGKASVNLLTETMDVIYDEKSLTQADIVAAVVKAGYGAQLMEEMGSAHKGAVHKGAAGSTGKGEDGKKALNRKLKEDARAMKWRLGISIGFLLVLC